MGDDPGQKVSAYDDAVVGETEHSIAGGDAWALGHWFLLEALVAGGLFGFDVGLLGTSLGQILLFWFAIVDAYLDDAVDGFPRFEGKQSL